MRTTARLIASTGPEKRITAKTADLDATRVLGDALIRAARRREAGRIISHVEPKVPNNDIPSTLGACADALYTLREQRLVVEKAAEAIKARETAIRDYLIDTLPKDDSTGTSGKVARAQIKTKRVPSVEDWPALYKYVKRTGAFELLQRRLANDAVAERWDAGKTVPGVGAFNTVTVSVTKL